MLPISWLSVSVFMSVSVFCVVDSSAIVAFLGHICFGTNLKYTPMLAYPAGLELYFVK